MKLSIIIPVYNVDQYLDRCLTSVLNQDLDDFEVICVDDASTDNSLEILRLYEKNYPNLKVYANEVNRTSSYCRKLGVEVASGEYIMFVDSDDEIVPGICKKLVKQMDAHGLDIIHFDTEIQAEDTVPKEAVNWFKKFSRPYYSELRGKMVFEGCFTKKLYRFNIWNKIYRTEVCKKAFGYIDDGRYPKAQDLYAFFIISFLAKSYMGIKEKGYVYRYGRGITGRKAEDVETFRRICSQSTVAKRCKEFLMSKNSYDQYRDELISIERDLLAECFSHLNRIDDENKEECRKILIESWSDSDIFYRAYLGINRPDLSPFEIETDIVERDETINIVFAANENYIPYLSVTLHSILLNKKCENLFRIHVLHEHISKNTLEYFSKIERPDFQIIPVSISKYIEENNLKPQNHIGVEMYYRLFIPNVLPDVKKAIYLDADLVVNTDLIDLYRIRLDGNIFGAVYNGTINYSAKKIIAKLGIDPRKYINSGVLLIDVLKFKEENVKDLCLNFLAINHNLSNPDQDALNKVCENKIKLLPLRWNYIWLYNLLYITEKDGEFKKYCEYYMENCSNPHIIHYAGKDKPWNSERGYINPKLYDIFWDYALESPYYEKIKEKAPMPRKYPVNSFNGYFVKGKRGYEYYSSINKNRYPLELTIWFEQNTGKKLNLINPKTFNEKIQWIKLFDNSPLKTMLADKYLSREWVESKIGKGYTVPLLGMWDSADEIDFDKLPNKFVLKTNHGSGWNYVVNDKSEILYEEIKLKMNLWLEKNYSFSSGFEMQYANIDRKIIAEEFIGDDLGLIDYRFYCFNGVPKQVWVDKYSGTKNHIREIFDTDWNKLDFTCTWPRANGELDSKPENYNEMLRISSILSEPFSFVRVDFFEVDSKLYVGELTFTPMSGMGKFNPPEYDLILGNMLKLPKMSFSKKVSTIFWLHVGNILKKIETIAGRDKVKGEKSIEQMREEVENWLNSNADRSKGITAIMLLAECRDSWAERRLAILYADGKYVEKDTDKALFFMRRAASSGNITAKKQLVDMLVKTGDRKFDKELFMIRLELAEEGEKTSMIRIAGMYLHGHGIEKDVNESLRWARAATDIDDGIDCMKQLVDSLVAVGTEECMIEAFSLRKKLAEEGEIVSQRNLADMYIRGEGTVIDKEAAIRWYKEAAKCGDKYSKEKLKELV
jgi:lipopolysaccharide biosynthesis glycosyltransferase